MIDPSFAVSLASAYPTPSYAYDLDEVQKRATIVLESLPEGGSLFFSLKANPLPALGEVICAKGAKAEVSSEGELGSALAAGFKAGEMLYSGPGKTDEEIEWALNKGVRKFSCESWNDLGRVATASCREGVKVDVLLRVNPANASSALLQMSGVASQFGFEEDDLISKRDRLGALPKNLRLHGLHIYYGTQIAGQDAFESSSKSAIDSAERLSEALNVSFSVLDLGGGFAWPFTSDVDGSEMEWLNDVMATISRYRTRTAGANLWFESGRYLVASSGTLLLKVLDVKASKEGKTFVVLDGGINVLGGMSGLGRIARVTARFERMTRRADLDGEEQYDIVGPLCSPLDCLARNLVANKLVPGDIVSIPNVGAYGLSASLVGFLSRPLPLEISYRGRKIINVSRHSMQSENVPLSNHLEK